MSDEREAPFEQIACIVCGKPAGMAAADCHRVLGQRNPLCRDYERCRIQEKTMEQYEYVLASSDRNIFLRACPGSGKTEAVGLKAAYEMRLWNHDCGGLAVLTFTNAAAETIRARVRQFTGNDLRYPHYVHTLDSWLHRYIVNPFGHLVTGYEGKQEGRPCDRAVKVIDHNAEGEWLEAFCTMTRYRRDNADADVPGVRVSANRILHLLGGPGFEFQPFPRMGANWLPDEERHKAGAFQKSYRNLACPTLQELRDDFTRTKQRFWRSGFVTHGDVAHICHKLLMELPKLASRLSRRFPVVIIDECQDLSPTQLAVLGILLEQGSNVQLVGDLCQAIYSFRKAEPEKVAAFAQEHGFNAPPLSENFRSYQSIVSVCTRLPVGACGIQGRHDADDGRSTCICFGYSKAGEAALVEQFAAYLDERDIPLDRCAIVARGRGTVARLYGFGTAGTTAPEELARALYLWPDTSRDARVQALAATGRCLADRFFAGSTLDTHAHSFYCPRDTFSPAHWRCILAGVLDAMCGIEGLRDLQQHWKPWVQLANAVLPCVVSDRCRLKLSMKAMQAPKRRGECSILAGFTARTSTPRIRITTIHGVKGETLEAVLVVSAQRKGMGGHWTEWLRSEGDDEHARFAYVASSRPRSLLAWAVPNPSAQDMRTLAKLGLSFLDGTPAGDVDRPAPQNLQLDI